MSVDPIVVVGPARGGTTLIADALACHPDVTLGLRESRFLDRLPIWTRRTMSEAAVRESLEEMILRALSRVTAWDKPNRRESLLVEMNRMVDVFLERRSEAQAWKIYEAILDISAHVEGARERCVVLDKSNAWWTARRAWRCLPRARFLFVLRDPRDLALTHARLAERNGSPRDMGVFVKCALYWRRFAIVGADLARRDPARVAVVRYEDFVLSQPATLQGVCASLGLSIPDDEEASAILASASGHGSYEKGAAPRGLHGSAVGRWKDAATEDEVASVELFMSPGGGADFYQPSGGAESQLLACVRLALRPRLTLRTLADLACGERLFAWILRFRESSHWRDRVSLSR